MRKIKRSDLDLQLGKLFSRQSHLAIRLGVVMVLATTLMLFVDCGGATMVIGGPVLSNCPSEAVIDAPFTLTLKSDTDMIIGVAITNSTNATVTSTRVGQDEFAIVVTPLEPGPVVIEFRSDFDGLPGTANYKCSFTAITNIGACCSVNICTEVVESFCDLGSNTFKGPGTVCSPNPCTGACCGSVDSDPNACVDTVQNICETAGGMYVGDSTTCEENGCPCVSDEGCPFPEDNCELATCTDGVCGFRPRCSPGQVCNSASGTCFTPDDAGSAGACCIGDGTCSDVSGESECVALAGQLGSTFKGANSICSNVVCVATIGACCIEGDVCVSISKESCIAQTSELAVAFQGVGFPCSDGLCTNPSGACCFNGVCQVLKEPQCTTSLNGVFIGANFPCSVEVAAMCAP